ncbi:hypothetical protein EU537_01340 [Candidatus Thorarchaeota archaeon]|nr:MAG: hypothetical protein EU537_01340 [Candidatus Thorarchaeota archaeon]
MTQGTNDVNFEKIRKASQGTKRVLREPIMKSLLQNSLLTETQLETLLIDLLVEDNFGKHIPYDTKASLRTTENGKGVSRGAFNRTLQQARENITKSIYTMLLLGYLGLFEIAIFRPFEEVAAKIGDYRHIREVLAGREKLTEEDLESHRAAEETIISALHELASPLNLKTELSKETGSE